MDITNPPLDQAMPAPAIMTLERLMRGAGILYATTIFQLIGRLLVTYIIAQALGAAGLGIYSIGFVTTQVLSMLAVNGQDTAILKFVSPAYRNGDGATVRVMLDAALILTVGVGLVLMIGMIVVFPFVIFASTGSADARAVAPLFAPSIVLQSVLAILGAFGLAHGQPQIKAIPEKVLGTVAQILATLLLLGAGLGLWAVVLGLVLANATSVLSCIWFLRKLYPRTVPVTGLRRAIRQLFGFSWKLGFANAAGYVLLNAALLVLGATSVAQAGLYAAASRLTLMGLLFLEAFGSNFSPLAASKFGDPSLEQDLQRVTVWIVVLSAPIYIVLFAFASQWMSFLGPDFTAAVPVLMILAFAQMLNMLTGNASALVSISHRPGLRVLNNIGGWGTNFILVLLLAVRFGAVGAAIAYLCGVLIVDTLEYVETRFVIGYAAFGKSIVKPLLWILLLWGVLVLVNVSISPNLWGAIALSIVFMAVYAAVMFLNGLPVADVTMLKRAVEKYSRSFTHWRIGEVK